jgi:FkbM family methyltransferase
MYREGVSLTSLLLWPVRSRFSEGAYVFSLRGGISFITPRDVDFELLFREIWVDEVYGQAGVRIPSGATVIDVGSNIGMFSLWAATRSRDVKVIAVEPSVRMCEFLRRNAAINKSRITVVQAACGGAERRTILYSPNGEETKNTLSPRSPHGQLRSLGEVEVISLERLFLRFDLHNCDLLKMDCEGGEYEILLNAPVDVLRRVRQIALEYHLGFDGEHKPEELEEFLGHNGFQVTTRAADGQTGYLYARRPAEA